MENPGCAHDFREAGLSLFQAKEVSYGLLDFGKVGHEKLSLQRPGLPSPCLKAKVQGLESRKPRGAAWGRSSLETHDVVSLISERQKSQEFSIDSSEVQVICHPAAI